MRFQQCPRFRLDESGKFWLKFQNHLQKDLCTLSQVRKGFENEKDMELVWYDDGHGGIVCCFVFLQ